MLKLDLISYSLFKFVSALFSWKISLLLFLSISPFNIYPILIEIALENLGLPKTLIKLYSLTSSNLKKCVVKSAKEIN